MSINDIKLKPCPFCGGDDVRVTHDMWSDYERRWFWRAGCWSDDCGAEIPFNDTKDEAIKAWDTRAETAQGGGE